MINGRQVSATSQIHGFSCSLINVNSRLRNFFLLILASLVLPSHCCYEDNYDYSGYDVGSTRAVSASACQDLCAKKEGCTYFTWSKSGGTCYFKSSKRKRKYSSRAISGPKRCPSTTTSSTLTTTSKTTSTTTTITTTTATSTTTTTTMTTTTITSTTTTTATTTSNTETTITITTITSTTSITSTITATTTTASTTTATATTATSSTSSTTLDAARLKAANITIGDLVEGGMPVEELISKGFSHLELVQAPNVNITTEVLRQAGVSEEDLKTLQSILDGSSSLVVTGLIVIVVVVAAVILIVVAIVCVCKHKQSSTDGRPSNADDLVDGHTSSTIGIASDQTGESISMPYGSIDPQTDVQRRPRKAGSNRNNPQSDRNRRSSSSSSNSRPRSASWMQDATRAVAETMLKGCCTGTFLVRPRNERSFAFSVIVRNRVIHKLIKKEANDEFTVDGQSGEWGSTLESVVAVVSVQLGTKYACAMHPLTVAQKPDENTKKKRCNRRPSAQPPQRMKGRPASSAGDATNAEVDETTVEMQGKVFAEVDESGNMSTTYTNTGAMARNGDALYETAFSMNPAYGSVEAAAAAAAPRPQNTTYTNTGAMARNGDDLYETAFSMNPAYGSVEAAAAAAAPRPQTATQAQSPLVLHIQTYQNDLAAESNGPTMATVSNQNPYASLLTIATTYGTQNHAYNDGFDSDSDVDSDIDI